MPPKCFSSSFCRKWGGLLFQTNFVAVGLHWGICPQRIFQIGATVLALKLYKGRVVGGDGGGGGGSLSISWAVFLTMKKTFNLNKI